MTVNAPVNSTTEQLYGMYRTYLPRVGRECGRGLFLDSINHVLEKGRYLMSFSNEGQLLGFVESFRVSSDQAKHLSERSIYEAENPDKLYPVIFDIVRENITEGPVCWLENIAIHFEHRTLGFHGPVQRDLLHQYWKQNRDAEVHMGHAERKVPGLIKILRKRGV